MNALQLLEKITDRASNRYVIFLTSDDLDTASYSQELDSTLVEGDVYDIPVDERDLFILLNGEYNDIEMYTYARNELKPVGEAFVAFDFNLEDTSCITCEKYRVLTPKFKDALVLYPL